VHRRLSILDVGESGHQPMCLPDSRAALTYNGEVYNYLELRGALGETAASLRSSGDTAVLLSALARDGEAALGRIEGMFAFAYVDVRTGRFLLARDALGIKPLFYVRRAEAIAFASEIAPLLTLPGITRRCDAEGAVQSLRFGLATPTSSSLFADIQQLRAGELLRGDVQEPGRAEIRRWYRLPEAPSFAGSRVEAVASVREEVLRSVDMHLRSDRTVGTALSGGVDSSAVVMGMRRVGGPGLDLRTITFVASTKALSEERWARLVSREAESQGFFVRSEDTDLAGDIDDYIRAQGEPVGGTSAYAQYCVYRAAAKAGLTVMLDGQGPDEMFAGYDFFLATRARELVWTGRFAAAARLVRSDHVREKGLGGLVLRQSMRRSAGANPTTERLRQHVGRPSIPPWVWSGGMRAAVRQHFATHEAPGFGGLHEHLRHSIEHGLVNLFRLADRNAMRFSIENRVPLATRRLADLALSLPSGFHFGADGSSKAVLRDAVRGLVPDAVLDRRDKIGFANDDATNLLKCSAWVEDVLDSASNCPFVDSFALRAAWKEWRVGRQATTSWLWSSLVFLRWWQLYRVSA